MSLFACRLSHNGRNAILEAKTGSLIVDQKYHTPARTHRKHAKAKHWPLIMSIFICATKLGNGVEHG